MNEFKDPLNDASDLSTILAKDAIYNAAGIVAYELYDEVSKMHMHSVFVLVAYSHSAIIFAKIIF